MARFTKPLTAEEMKVELEDEARAGAEEVRVEAPPLLVGSPILSPSKKRYRVLEDCSILFDHVRVLLKKGKVFSEGHYDMRRLVEQGVKFEEIPEIPAIPAGG